MITWINFLFLIISALFLLLAMSNEDDPKDLKGLVYSILAFFFLILSFINYSN